MSLTAQIALGIVMAIAVFIAWLVLVAGVEQLEAAVTRYLDRRMAEYEALAQSAADAFDAHWDDVADLFPQSVDELAIRRVGRGGGPTT